MSKDTRFSPDFTGVAKDKSYYALTMFPYPSGSGLHCGHASVFTINDVVARYKRMQGFAVLNPFGFDAFGLPTENYAIQQGKPAREVTDINKQHFLDQVEALNMSFDMERIIDTSEPEYYKWTQWIFSKLYEAGLAFKDTLWVNRCPSCMTVLANDQVVDGACERCKSEIIQKKHPQWFIKITDYADRLIADLDTVDRPEETKIAQRNRIGRSEGAEIEFEVALTPQPPLPTTPRASSLGEGEEVKITCFTTRPDTIYGVTAIVLAPENTLLDDMLDDEHTTKVHEYRQTTLAKTAVQRQKDLKEKTGVNSGLFAIHPLTQKEIPIRYADYVLAGYGSGAVMSVPAHDARDKEFAEKFGLEVVQVIRPLVSNTDFDSIELERIGGYCMIKHESEEMYLVVKADGKIMFPGGGIDEGESIQQGAVREVIEETGYKNIEIKSKLIEMNAKHYFKKIGGGALTNATIFKASLMNDENNGLSLTKDEKKSGMQYIWMSEQQIVSENKDVVWEYLFNVLLGKVTIREGTLMNSGEFNGLSHVDGQKMITAHLEDLGVGRKKVTYKLRDWSVSRQRYWGSPVPIWYDEEGNDHLVPESELPVVLPLDLEDYKPTGKSPLEDHPTFPKYGENGTRECDTLDTFMCSSFYFLRFPDAHNDEELIRKELAESLLPVDFYSGGKEHTVGHLLYSRFIHKFLFDQGYVDSPEPFKKLIHQGMVLGSDGRKMGKRYGNGIDPTEVVNKYGADAVRTYMMFMGPVEADKPWSDTALNGVAKFLKRVERLMDDGFIGDENDEIESALNIAIKGVTEDIEKLKLNTCISKLMILNNFVHMKNAGSNKLNISKRQLLIIAQLLAPFATELAEKIWKNMGGEGDVHFSLRPIYDETKIIEAAINIPVQINGKVRGFLVADTGLTEDEVVRGAMTLENIEKRLEGKDLVKIIWVQDKILNLIVK